MLIHPLCLSVCTCTSVRPDACIYNAEVLSMCNKHLMLGQTAVTYTHTYTHSHIQHFHSQAQYSINSHEKHTHSLKRWKPGKNVGWQGRQMVILQIKRPCEHVKQSDRQTAVRFTQTSKQTKNKYMYTNTCTQVCMLVWLSEERERISVTLVTTTTQGCASDLCMCARVCADSWRACS
jgi:hypothetical protein